MGKKDEVYEEEETEERETLTIAKIMETDNIATLLDEETLNKLALKVEDVYEADSESRSDWMAGRAKALELVKQEKKKKNSPFEGAANIKYPLMTNASVQFAARASSAILNTDQMVKCKVQGADMDGMKAERAKRVGKHMSYQISTQMVEWESSFDRLLHLLPVADTLHREVSFDPGLGRNVVTTLTPDELVVNYWAHPDRDPDTATKKVFLTGNAIKERESDGRFIDCKDVLEAMKDRDSDVEKAGQTEDAKKDDSVSPVDLFLEQHGWFDLDGDGYKEPYIVTVHKESGTVVRIVKRFSDKEILVNEKGKVRKIKGYWHFVKYDFMPSVDGGYYGNGYGSILKPINETLNSLINQLVDAGTLGNSQGGFFARGLNMKAGALRFKLGEWKPIDSKGMAIKDALFPLPAGQPSGVLFEMAMKMLEAGEKLASNTEVMMGENPGGNTPATTTLALIEQGSQVYSNILKRIYRSLKQEFNKLFRLNSEYLPPQQYFTFHDKPEVVDLSDYEIGSLDVEPVADPTIVSKQQQLTQAEALMKTLDVNPQDNRGKLILKRYYEAVAPDIAEQLMPEEGEKEQQQPSPEQAQAQAEQQQVQAEMQLKQQELQLKGQQMQAEMEVQMKELQIKAQETMAKAMKMQADAELAIQKAASMRKEDTRDDIIAKEEIKDANERRSSDLESKSDDKGGDGASPK